MKHLDARRSFFSEIVRHCVFCCGIFLFFLPISLHASKEGLDVKPGTQVVVPEGYAKIEAGDIELYFPPGGRQRAGELLDRATEAMGRLVTMIGYRPEMKTRIYLAGSTKDWRLLQPGRQKVPNWAAGIAFPYIGVVVLRQAAERGGAIDLDTTLVHELSHIVFRQATKGKPVPKWFVEGIAIYHSEDFSLERAKLLVTAAATGRLYTLAELSHGFRVTDISLAYAQSFEFVNFLVGEFGRRNMNRFVKKLAEGTEFDTALTETFGKSLDELEKEWISTIKLRWNWIPLLFSSSTLWFATSILFLMGYVKRRREKARKMKEWEEMERERDRNLFPETPLGNTRSEQDAPEVIPGLPPTNRNDNGGPTIH